MKDREGGGGGRSGVHASTCLIEIILYARRCWCKFTLRDNDRDQMVGSRSTFKGNSLMNMRNKSILFTPHPGSTKERRHFSKIVSRTTSINFKKNHQIETIRCQGISKESNILNLTVDLECFGSSDIGATTGMKRPTLLLFLKNQTKVKHVKATIQPNQQTKNKTINQGRRLKNAPAKVEENSPRSSKISSISHFEP
jgi:hypothetical protein